MLEMSKHFIDIKADDGNTYAYNSIFGNRANTANR